MAADFNKVITTEAYATLLATITDLFKDMVKGLDPALALGTLNIPTNALRWNSANKYWEKYNGTAWAAMSADYGITITGSAAKWTTGRTIQLTGDVTGTSAAFDGSGNLSFSVTLATVTAAKGGTGQAGGYAVGDMLYASGASALSKLADVATGNALLSGGVGVAPSWGKVGLTTHISGTLSIANGGTNATTAAAARTNLGLAIGTDVMGMGGGAFTGPVSATNLSGTNTGDEPDASLTLPGIIELATAAEVQAATDAVRAVTPATLAACYSSTTQSGVIRTATDVQAKAMGVTAYAITPSNLYAMRFESAEYAFAAGTMLALTHGMGSTPLASIEAVFRCKIAEGNYAVGDEIIYSSHYDAGNQAFTVWKNTTQLGISFLTGVVACNKTTGAGFTLTAANWKVVLRASLN